MSLWLEPAVFPVLCLQMIATLQRNPSRTAQAPLQILSLQAATFASHCLQFQFESDCIPSVSDREPLVAPVVANSPWLNGPPGIRNGRPTQ